MKMIKLSDPSKDLARRIVGELGFDDRLVGYTMKTHKGFMQVPLYSFEEVVGFLNTPIPWIELSELEAWVRETIGDEELAARIKKQIGKDAPDIKKTVFIRDLMGQRLIQCKKVA
jgi:hypothetical protein